MTRQSSSNRNDLLNLSQGSESLGQVSESSSRRSVHGGSAWSLPAGKNAMLQPQDGAQVGVVSAARALLSSIRYGNPLAEPEDAKMTGGTRSLTRRLLGLNVMAAPRKAPMSVLKGLPKQQLA